MAEVGGPLFEDRLVAAGAEMRILFRRVRPVKGFPLKLERLEIRWPAPEWLLNMDFSPPDWKPALKLRGRDRKTPSPGPSQGERRETPLPADVGAGGLNKPSGCGINTM
ncbi:MAG: hypothetical protein LBR53_04000 [Deltaproteobacteria bacterium]|nr:hypothetical protein [Deltaproteobacteria bacterium]